MIELRIRGWLVSQNIEVDPIKLVLRSDTEYSVV